MTGIDYCSRNTLCDDSATLLRTVSSCSTATICVPLRIAHACVQMKARRAVFCA